MHPSATKIIDLYERHAQSWDVDRGKSLFEEPWLARFRGAMGDDTSILDIGCGSGEPIARYFVDNAHKVTGIDSSASLIHICSTRFPEHTGIAADMRELSLVVQFSGIIAWDSFFHLSPGDQRAMFPVFRAHAKRGTALLFTSGPDHGEAIGSYQGEPLYHASLSASEYEALLKDNGFETLAHVVEDSACGGRTVWLARLT